MLFFRLAVDMNMVGVQKLVAMCQKFTNLAVSFTVYWKYLCDVCKWVIINLNSKNIISCFKKSVFVMAAYRLYQPVNLCIQLFPDDFGFLKASWHICIRSESVHLMAYLIHAFYTNHCMYNVTEFIHMNVCSCYLATWSQVILREMSTYVAIN